VTALSAHCQPLTPCTVRPVSAFRLQALGRPLRKLDPLRGHAAIRSLRSVMTDEAARLADMPNSVHPIMRRIAAIIGDTPGSGTIDWPAH
jgi:hypothetical protein